MIQFQIGDVVRCVDTISTLNPNDLHVVGFVSPDAEDIGIINSLSVYPARAFTLFQPHGSIAAPDPVPPTATPFWMVWRTNGGVPTKKHRTLHAAEAEATRLAEQNPGVRFFVLEALSFYERESAPITKGVMQAKSKGVMQAKSKGVMQAKSKGVMQAKSKGEKQAKSKGEKQAAAGQMKIVTSGCWVCQDNEAFCHCSEETPFPPSETAQGREADEALGKSGPLPSDSLPMNPRGYMVECRDPDCDCHAALAGQSSRCE